MPGYNHYPTCTCGWCVKYGRGGYANPAATTYVRPPIYVGSPSALLREHGVRSAISACFVNPNARCPVCGASVFYYQNSFGSRVYFDALGPPWPKHPCTDNATRHATPVVLHSERPTRRARGIMMELLDAFRVVEGKGADDDQRGVDVWRLILIRAISRSGWRNSVSAAFVQPDDDSFIAFSFDSTTQVAQEGDIISLKGDEISLFDVTAMKPKRYKIAIEREHVSSSDEN